MVYDSIRADVWEQLHTDRPRRKQTPTRADFNRICAAFYQAENCQISSDQAAHEIKTYRAEYNIWAYFCKLFSSFGEDAGFPGKDPANTSPASLHTETTTSMKEKSRDPRYITRRSSASPPRSPSYYVPYKSINTLPDTPGSMRECLERTWRSRTGWIDYQPQLGWDPATGAPWMTVRCYAADAYPALSGSHHRYMKSFEKKIPQFVVKYERFESCILIWPEFRDPADLSKPEVWEEFNRLRAFLTRWAGAQKGVPVFKAYKAFLELPEEERGPLPFPEGFDSEYDRVIRKGGMIKIKGMADRHEQRIGEESNGEEIRRERAEEMGEGAGEEWSRRGRQDAVDGRWERMERSRHEESDYYGYHMTDLDERHRFQGREIDSYRPRYRSG
ncbi:uncharacterized protein LY89DRAFT_722584 [Mollisia scopiformis]|uniref:Uncharacterized protein n=1 Tax=Mollisia scopiformis TaxID=149040 RepID=A0A194WTX8_MOLSC|nr:uncharacterized protein LY89DRAFT_722584 [Mollisia scopiformis]KUJ11415.1 hypothetical protein LY89DRAFT_722584 [Mollisia scopiformis]